MHKYVLAAIAVFALALLSVPAFADILSFTGPYAPANWTVSSADCGSNPTICSPGTGLVVWSADSSSVTLTGGAWYGNPAIWMIAPATGTITFDYWGLDFNHGGLTVWEGGMWSLVSGYYASSGSVTYDVTAGNIIGFETGTNSLYFTDSVTIGDFSAPGDASGGSGTGGSGSGGTSATPEPCTLLLGATGLAGIFAARRRSRA